MVSEIRFFKKMKKKKKKKNGQSVKIVFTCISHLLRYFHPFFCMQLLFHMFSTLMSLEDRLKAEIEISLCVAIMQNHPLPSLYTQYYRTV